MILYVIADYANANDRYKAGDIIEVSPIQAEWLIADSFGSFSKEKPTPIVEAPPKDKAVKARKVMKK